MSGSRRPEVEMLQAQGYDEDAARSRLALLDAADRTFTHVIGARPRWRWVIPGRLEVFGKHTD